LSASSACGGPKDLRASPAKSWHLPRTSATRPMMTVSLQHHHSPSNTNIYTHSAPTASYGRTLCITCFACCVVASQPCAQGANTDCDGDDDHDHDHDGDYGNTKSQKVFGFRIDACCKRCVYLETGAQANTRKHRARMCLLDVSVGVHVLACMHVREMWMNALYYKDENQERTCMHASKRHMPWMYCGRTL
jgi:hypothetical protein